jgi:hypothetical protein
LAQATIEAPEWSRVPGALRRAGGSSICRPHGVERYATLAQLTMEERLTARADQACLLFWLAISLALITVAAILARAYPGTGAGRPRRPAPCTPPRSPAADRLFICRGDYIVVRYRSTTTLDGSPSH